MPRPLRILLVAPTTSLSHVLVGWLHPVGYEVSVASQFTAARIRVDMEPDLLITELKLRDHNGLHLALRAHTRGVPSIVIGDPDRVLERDAAEIGATYLHAASLEHDEFMKVVESLLRSEPRVHRNHLAWLDHAPPTNAGSLGTRAGRPVLH